MSEHRPGLEPTNLNLASVLFALFKRKKTILCFTAAGLIAATAVHFLWPHAYESDATLLVRYVVDRSAVDPETNANANQGSATFYATKMNDTFINAEVAILKSWDLAVQVAEALGPKRVLPDAKKAPTLNDAANAVSSGLDVVSTKNSNIIVVSYQNPRPDVASLVLNEFVNRYFVKHLEVHRSAGAFDFVSQQTDQVRARLNQTEDALKAVKGKVGIVDFKDSTTALTTEAIRVADQLHDAEGDLAEQRARVKLFEGTPGPPPAKTGDAEVSGEATASPAAAQPASADIEQYKALVARLGQLQQTALDLQSKYTDGSIQVKSTRSQIEDLEKQKQQLEKKFPGLSTIGSSAGHTTDIGTERARLAGLDAKAEMLRRQASNIQERLKQLADASPEIARLERSKELEEANYKYFEGTLEKARVDEALDPSKMPNISAVQRPSPPTPVVKLRDRIVWGLVGGGIALGLAFALATELFLNRTVKRPLELEQQLGTLPFLTIPFSGSNGRWRLRNRGNSRGGEGIQSHGEAAVAPWDPGHFIRPYAGAIRDRLGFYFELHGSARKPKLVGVTGFHEGAGSSTLAAGLAAALSETGDGKVLLVDANVANGEAHPFFAGRPAVTLTSAIEPSAPAAESPAENLYLATIAAPDAHPARVGLKKFFALMPNLKASDFDYVIFDLPPLNQTSPTIGLAGLMHKVLLIVDAEKDNRDAVKRGYRDLVSVRADISVVLNKARSYVPKWLDGTT